MIEHFSRNGYNFNNIPLLFYQNIRHEGHSHSDVFLQ